MFFILAQLWSTGFEVHLQTAAFCFPCMCRPSMESHNGCQSDAGFFYFLVGDVVTSVGSINMCADIL